MTEWKLYTKVNDAWEAMLEDCRKADKSIDCEQYIFRADEISQKFVELFIAKAKKGVKVRLLCDAVGSTTLYTSSLVSELDQAGVKVEFFNPISLWRIHNFTSWFFRDHRKLLIVDGAIGYTGGVGINNEMKDWRDTQVRITGPVLEHFQYVFDHMWRITEEKRFIPFRSSPSYAEGFELIPHSPHRRQRFIHRRFLDILRTATQYIYLTTPYFVPDYRFFRIMRLAARRKVDVRLLLPENSDVPVVNMAARWYLGRALQAGVKIYQYIPEKLHAKTIAIDDNWGTVGSINLDNLSFRFNYEANLIASEPAFVREIKKQFMQDLEVSKELTLNQWRQRPWLDKIEEFAVLPLHSFL